MEDFYDVKLTEIDGQAVSLFGIFDGMDSNLGLCFCAYFLLPCFSFQNLDD
jgi:hypothetical protein